MSLLETINNPNAIFLSNTQKLALAAVISAPTTQMAYESISKNQQMIAARNFLVRIGALASSVGSAKLTETGNDIAMNHNIVDQTGQLTDDAKQLLDQGARLLEAFGMVSQINRQIELG